MRMRRIAAWLICGLMSLAANPAFAHKLKVFALVDGDHIAGSVYFVGGARATGAAVTVTDPNGTELARLAPDAEGAFRFRPTQRIDHMIIADTSDGHVARWTIRADTLPAGLGAAAPTPDPEPSAAAVAPREAEPVQSMTKAPVSDEALGAAIEQAVARQLRPLRQQLEAHDSRVRLQDVLGGIGYIAGLAGLGLWWYGARRRRP
jgi:nickel transport protein